MKFEEYIVQSGEKLRLGYTTGTCAVATTTAACEALKENREIDIVKVQVPAGYELILEVREIYREKNTAAYSIIKDAGDDPDVTDGIEIISTVSLNNSGKIEIDGGEGVGRIVREGIFGKVGAAAINPVPRQELEKVLNKYNKTGIKTVISVPEGKEIAKKTFNANLGIVDGISILGTKGIVYPMSEEAYIKSMVMEVDLYKEQGYTEILLTPGNYGLNIASELGIDCPVIKVSNFLGEILRYVEAQGFKKIYVIGHIGKLAKTSIGIFNTHSKVADTRMEAFVYYLYFLGASREIIEHVNGMITAEKALDYCIEQGYGHIVQAMEAGCKERILKYIRNEDIEVEVYIYSMSQEIKR